jgi:hypothetical protein
MTKPCRPPSRTPPMRPTAEARDPLTRMGDWRLDGGAVAIRTNSEQVAKSFHYLLGELLFWFGGSNAVYCATEPRHS